MKDEIKTIVGLFIPVKWEDNRWAASVAISGIPLGLIMIVIAVMVNLLMN